MNETSESIFDRVGAPALGSAVDLLFDRALADPSLAPFFRGIALDRLKARFAAYLSELLGGPRRYQGRPLAVAHADLGIQEDHLYHFIGHLDDALRAAGVDEAIAHEVMTALAPRAVDVVSSWQDGGSDTEATRDGRGASDAPRPPATRPDPAGDETSRDPDDALVADTPTTSPVSTAAHLHEHLDELVPGVDVLAGAVLLVDPDLVVVHENPAATSLRASLPAGAAAAPLRGRPLSQLHPDAARVVSEATAFPVAVRCAFGGTVLRVLVTPVDDAMGTPAGFVVELHDVTNGGVTDTGVTDGGIAQGGAGRSGPGRSTRDETAGGRDAADTRALESLRTEVERLRGRERHALQRAEEAERALATGTTAYDQLAEARSHEQELRNRLAEASRALHRAQRVEAALGEARRRIDDLEAGAVPAPASDDRDSAHLVDVRGAEIDRLTTELTAARAARAEADRAATEAVRAAAELRVELDELRDRAAGRARDDADLAEVVVAELEAELDDANRREVALREREAALRDELAVLIAQIERLGSDGAENRRLQDDLDVLVDEREQLLDELDAAHAREEDLVKLLDEQEIEVLLVSELRDELRAAGRHADALARELSDLRDETESADGLKRELIEARSREREVRGELADAERRLDALASTEDELVRSQHRAQRLATELQQAEEQMVELRARERGLVDELAAARVSSRRLQDVEGVLRGALAHVDALDRAVRLAHSEITGSRDEHSGPVVRRRSSLSAADARQRRQRAGDPSPDSSD